jgi:hypothetical protein
MTETMDHKNNNKNQAVKKKRTLKTNKSRTSKKIDPFKGEIGFFIGMILFLLCIIFSCLIMSHYRITKIENIIKMEVKNELKRYE